MINEARLRALFLNLLAFDAPSLMEGEVVDWTRAYLEKIGLQVWEDDAAERLGGNANNLIALLPGNLPGAPRIFLSAHFDGVESTAGLQIIEEDGVFQSSGDTILGADDKAGMAPAIEAVHRLLETGDPHGDVYLLLSVAEEIGLKGASVLKIEDLNLDFGYVLDTGPPVGGFVTRAATHDNLDITIHGKPAHAGKDPEKGINAMQVAADAIHGMRLGRIGPETTANLGTIEGGTGVNVVCPYVKIRAEARSTSLEELEAQVNHMVEKFTQAAEAWGATLTIEHHRHYGSYHVDNDSLVVKIAEAASRKLGLEPTLRTTLGGSDANVYNAKGVPTIVVATAMDKIHTHQECAKWSEVVSTAELAYELLLGAAQGAA